MTTATRDLVEIPGGLTTLAWALVTNAVTVVGVLVWGWPAGNVFLLFIVENIATMLLAYLVLRRTVGRPGATPPGFFLLHSGIFTFVHAVFSLVIALMLGVEPSLLSLGLPVALLLVRFAAETWSLIRATADGPAPRPPGVIAHAYGRVFALHVGIFPGLFAAISTVEAGGSATFDQLTPYLGFAPTYGQVVVLALMAIKSVADVIVSVVVMNSRSHS